MLSFGKLVWHGTTENELAGEARRRNLDWDANVEAAMNPLILGSNQTVTSVSEPEMVTDKSLDRLFTVPERLIELLLGFPVCGLFDDVRAFLRFGRLVGDGFSAGNFYRHGHDRRLDGAELKPQDEVVEWIERHRVGHRVVRVKALSVVSEDDEPLEPQA